VKVRLVVDRIVVDAPRTGLQARQIEDALRTSLRSALTHQLSLGGGHLHSSRTDAPSRAIALSLPPGATSTAIGTAVGSALGHTVWPRR
jgi:hypothetical protein